MKERSVRACQPCRLRKVKCTGNGEQECTQCMRLNLKCVYPESNPSSKLRRSTVRGSIIRSYLDSEHQSNSTQQAESRLIGHGLNEAPSHSSVAFDAKFFYDLVPDYSKYVLATFPVVTESELITAIGRMNDSSDDYALVHSLGAVTWAIIHDKITAPESYLNQVRSLYTKALNARGHFLKPSHVSIESIMTSTFISKCFADADQDSRACYYYNREAITKLQMLRVDDTHHQPQQTEDERQRRQRTYWLLFIQERFDALSNFRPVVLSPLPDFPKYNAAMPMTVHIGLIRLIELFRMVDEKFIRYRLDSSSSLITVDWIRQKQAELGNNIEAWEEDISSLTLIQQADLCVTRHWLRALVWQMSLQMFLVLPDGRAEEDYMSILFPVQLSRKLRSLLSSMPREAIEIHSTGIVHKIFEITAVSADVLEHVIARAQDPLEHSSHIEDFVFLSRFCSSMPRFNERTELESRFQRVRSLFPWYFEQIEQVATMW